MRNPEIYLEYESDKKQKSSWVTIKFLAGQMCRKDMCRKDKCVDWTGVWKTACEIIIHCLAWTASVLKPPPECKDSVDIIAIQIGP